MRRAVALWIAYCAFLVPLRAQESDAIGHLLYHVRDDKGEWHQRTAAYVPRAGCASFTWVTFMRPRGVVGTRIRPRRCCR